MKYDLIPTQKQAIAQSYSPEVEESALKFINELEAAHKVVMRLRALLRREQQLLDLIKDGVVEVN